MITRPVIAIDGPAASGKGTLARKIAAALGFAHLDTGLLYRAVAHRVLESGGDPNDAAAALDAAQRLAAEGFTPTLTLPPMGGGKFDFSAIETTLKVEKVTEAASLVAAMPGVRAALLELQKSFAADPGEGARGAVLDGRDIGTVICPEARAKLFVTASLETRTGRRLKELQSRGIPATREAVSRDMRERDTRDAARKTAPMKPAGDALEIDTTHLTPDQALEKALGYIRKRLNA